MNIIPIISSDVVLNSEIEKTLAENLPSSSIMQISTVKEAVDVLNVELPDLIFVNFSDSAFDARTFIASITTDPWLLHGGIIGICEDCEEVRKMEELRGANLIVNLAREEIRTNLPKVLSIIDSNRRILFQREIGADLVENISGSFKLNNDPLEASCYTNLICNFLFNANRIDTEQKFKLNFSIYEMLINAIEHGNCGITYDEKSTWLEKSGTISNLLHQKCLDQALAARKVTFEYALGPSSARFLIADEGDGFDWRSVKDPTAQENLYELHGRGVLMTKKFTSKFEYNDKGNEVRFEVKYQADESLLTPALLKNMKARDVNPGDIVFSQGDPGDFLYYVVKGKYDVVVNDRVVSSLSPDDIFMGEMSFLLNNRRSATVRAQTPGKLIEISKRDFVNAIKKKPHYALFLSRLLAQRVNRANTKQS